MKDPTKDSSPKAQNDNGVWYLFCYSERKSNLETKKGGHGDPPDMIVFLFSLSQFHGSAVGGENGVYDLFTEIG